MSEFIKKHKTGIIGTIIFHGMVVVLFMLFGYSTPLPLPGEEGILINFGDTETGMGDIEPRITEPVKQQPVKEQEESVEEAVPTPSEDGAVTQDFEEAPAVKEQGKKEEEKTEEVKKETEEETKEEQTEEKEEEVREVNQQALFTGRNKDNDENTSEGITEGEGNQGSKTGSTESDNYSDLNSSGNNGINYSLDGRNPESLPKPEYNYQMEGKVVVEITVNRDGDVTDANPGVKGSTTLEATLLAAAKKAALKAKFDRKPDAPAFQKGTITYYFRLQ
ncbi:MAG TPA: TonB family protein [Bacteroidales bacterium]|nr:TonB family protein [Bacteroidales bacterium]